MVSKFFFCVCKVGDFVLCLLMALSFFVLLDHGVFLTFVLPSSIDERTCTSEKKQVPERMDVVFRRLCV